MKTEKAIGAELPPLRIRLRADEAIEQSRPAQLRISQDPEFAERSARRA
jgi:hypothetical protein